MALCLVALGLSSCAGLGNEGSGAAETITAYGVMIDGFVIHNGLFYPVTDVMIEVPATGAFAGCGNILPRTACRSGFEAIDYITDTVRVDWKEHGAPHSTDEFVIEVPEDLPAGAIAEVEVVIFAPGQAGARLVRKVP